MPFWFNKAEKEGDFSNLACSDYTTLNSVVDFQEFGYKSDDDFHHVFGYANRLTDFLNLEDRNFKFIPQLVQFKISRKNYQRYDSKQKKKVDVEQSSIEKLICILLEKLDASKIWQGSFTLQTSQQVTMLLSGKASNGQDLPESVFEMMAATYLFGVDEVTEPKFITLDKFSIPEKKGGNWGGSKGQTEAEKLQDRLDFIFKQLKVVAPDFELLTIADLSKLLVSNAQAPDILDLCERLMK